MTPLSPSPIIFLRNRRTEFLSIEDADKEQRKLFKELCNVNKSQKPIENKTFLKSLRFLFDAREKVIISVESNVFPLKNSTSEPATDPSVFDGLKPAKAQTKKTKHKISPLKLHECYL